MKNTIVKLGLSLVAIPGLLFPGLANAQSCGTWASNIVAQYKSSAPRSGRAWPPTGLMASMSATVLPKSGLSSMSRGTARDPVASHPLYRPQRRWPNFSAIGCSR